MVEFSRTFSIVNTNALYHTLQDGLEAEDEVDLLHLEDVPGKAQRCFASVGTGVRVFLLSSGKLLNSLPDLHSVPISALMFFRPLRLVVTASRDGASKLSNG